jgi:hypothetical protein
MPGNPRVLAVVDAWTYPVASGIIDGFAVKFNRNLLAGVETIRFYCQAELQWLKQKQGSVKMGQPILRPITTWRSDDIRGTNMPGDGTANTTYFIPPFNFPPFPPTGLLIVHYISSLTSPLTAYFLGPAIQVANVRRSPFSNGGY